MTRLSIIPGPMLNKGALKNQVRAGGFSGFTWTMLLVANSRMLFCNKDGCEVDIVLVRDIAGIEVKAAATVTQSDFRGLRKLKDVSGARFAAGVVLYDDESAVRFGDNLFAIPIAALWSLK